MFVLDVGAWRSMLRRGARAVARAIVRVARLDDDASSRENADPPQTGNRDAGWARVLRLEDQRLLGRGRLMMRLEHTRPDGAPSYAAWLESFGPSEEPQFTAGDRVLLLIETSNEHYPVTVQAMEAQGSVVSMRWTADELPATLRELGGARG